MLLPKSSSSPPVWVAWIEIMAGLKEMGEKGVATRMGGVD